MEGPLPLEEWEVMGCASLSGPHALQPRGDVLAAASPCPASGHAWGSQRCAMALFGDLR